MSSLITTKLAAARSRHVAVAIGEGLSQAIVFAICWIAATMILDRLFELPYLFRAVTLAALLASLGWIIAKRLVFPIVYGPDDEELALAVERECPEFRTRLIAAVQLSRPNAITAGSSASLVRAMVAQTEELATPLNFAGVIKTDRLIKVGIALAIALVLSSATFLWGGHRSRALLQRAFLFNIALPTRTSVTVLTDASTIGRGDDLRLLARADGYIPSYGRAEITYASGKRATYTLAPVKEDPTTFAAYVNAVQESFTYRIWLYDGHSDTMKVTVLQRPAVASINCTLVYPAYTGLPDEPRAVTDLGVLAGSKLRLKILASFPVRKDANAKGQFNAARRFVGEKDYSDIALTVNPANPRQLTGEMDIPEGTNAFCINLVDDNDISSKDPAVYKIEIVPDRPPTIHIVSPDRKEMLGTIVSKLDVGFVAEDDYCIGTVALKYKTDDGAVESMPINIAPKQRTLRNHFIWDVSAISIPANKPNLEGSSIEYWLEVADTNNQSKSGPGKGISDKFLLRIVSRAEKQAELMARLGESLTGIRDLSDNQEKANTELGTLVTGGGK